MTDPTARPLDEQLAADLYEAEQAAARMAEKIANDEAIAAGYGPYEVRAP